MSDEASSPLDARSSDTKSSKAAWPNYRTLWRWHFFAGVACLPLVIVLSVTGTIYLFRPQIESWQQSQYDRMVTGATALPIDEQVRLAMQQIDGSQFVTLELDSPNFERSATRMLLAAGGKTLITWVDPTNGNVLGQVDRNQTFLRKVRRIHGELMLGKRGSYLVETIASWTIVLVITGLALWMPRKIRAAGVLYPRVFASGKTFVRDLHSVIGFWASGLIVFLIATGLPWSTFWGDYFKSVRRITGMSVAVQSWDGGHEDHSPKPKGGSPWAKSAPDPTTYDLAELNSVANHAQALNWLPPVTVSPPSDGDHRWTIKSETGNRPYRQTIVFDAQAGSVCHHETFDQKHWVDRIVGNGIALHEGQRFVGKPMGWLNQAAALFATFALVGLSVSGTMLWWRRGRSFSLVAPMASTEALVVSRPRQIAVVAIILGLAVYLPLFGVTLVLVCGFDFLRTRLCWQAVKRATAVLLGAASIGLFAGGCDRSEPPVAGGTKGTVTSGGRMLSQVQLNVYTQSGLEFQRIAVGVVRDDGTFDLVTPDATSPVTLEPGRYPVTVESLGAEIDIPSEFQNADSQTPRYEYEAAADREFKIEFPEFAGMEGA